MSERDGGPAFQTIIPRGNGLFEVQPGMSLRDWFAGQALVGILGSEVPDWRRDTEEAVDAAYDYADAMLAERQKVGS